MNKRITSLLTILAVALFFGAAQAMEHGGHGATHDGHAVAMEQDHAGHGGHGDMASGHMGEQIRMTTVDGHHLKYELIDMKARMAGHDMPAEMKSHHLMVYVTGPQGDQVSGAKIGYLVTGPDGEQKAMTMPMSGGYGADVDLEPAGAYTVKTKVVTPEGSKLMDEFTYEAK